VGGFPTGSVTIDCKTLYRVGISKAVNAVCFVPPPPAPPHRKSGWEGSRGAAIVISYHAASNAGTGSAVTDLIFSMAKRDVTFLSATAPISFL